MLEHLKPGGQWKGSEVFGDTTNTGTDSERVGFRHLRSGTQILFKPEEWRTLKDLFLGALALKENPTVALRAIRGLRRDLIANFLPRSSSYLFVSSDGLPCAT
jgi:hypothetical protein